MKIESTISEMSQSLLLQSLHKIEGKIVRIKIERDAYDFQSSCVAEILTNNGWTEIWSIPPVEMTACKQKISYINKKCSNCLYDDEEELIRITKTILRWKTLD